MHWYMIILLLLGLVCGLRLHPLAFALLIVLIVAAIAACDYWNRTAYSEIALDSVVAAVTLQVGYVLGVLVQIAFRRLSPNSKSGSSTKK
jgi:uncharacterized membrane protein YphA (DoxX/SURF4 family)